MAPMDTGSVTLYYDGTGSLVSVQTAIEVVFGVTFFFATTALALRYVQTLVVVKKFELDLVLVTLSYGCCIVDFVTTLKLLTIITSFMEVTTTEAYVALLNSYDQILTTNTISALICPGLTKLAILSALYQISPARLYRYSCLAIVGVIIAHTVTVVVIAGVPCNPLKGDGTLCLTNVALAHGMLNIVSDLAVIALPIPTLHGLNMRFKAKVQVGCLIGLGSAAVVCSIARLPYIIALRNAGESHSTYMEGQLSVWTFVELNVGITCSCAMRLRPLLIKYIPKLSVFNSSGRGKNSGPENEEVWSDRRRAYSNSYQLWSVQKSSVVADTSGDGGVGSELDQDGHIRVQKSFRIEEVSKNGGSDKGSTDEILR